jgi:hypothetical protein
MRSHASEVFVGALVVIAAAEVAEAAAEVLVAA